jgi:hypothetical protein
VVARAALNLQVIFDPGRSLQSDEEIISRAEKFARNNRTAIANEYVDLAMYIHKDCRKGPGSRLLQGHLVHP